VIKTRPVDFEEWRTEVKETSRSRRSNLQEE
jgi:hypothetical protein